MICSYNFFLIKSNVQKNVNEHFAKHENIVKYMKIFFNRLYKPSRGNNGWRVTARIQLTRGASICKRISKAEETTGRNTSTKMTPRHFQFDVLLRIKSPEPRRIFPLCSFLCGILSCKPKLLKILLQIKSRELLRIFALCIFYIEAFGANQNCWNYGLEKVIRKMYKNPTGAHVRNAKNALRSGAARNV